MHAVSLSNDCILYIIIISPLDPFNRVFFIAAGALF